MTRAPWPLGLLLGASLVVVIGLLGPLALFNPWFTSAHQARHDVPAALGASPDETASLTATFLTDIFTGGAFDAALAGQDEPFLDADERSHMRDVSALVRILSGALIVALLVALGSAAWLRRDPGRIGRVMLVAAGTVGTLAVLGGLTFALAFDAAFTAFHELFFPPGTWQFEVGSDLITLFPQGFWFDAALLAGASILVVAVVVSVAGFATVRAARASGASA